MKSDLERLSGILKGILLYKQEQEMLIYLVQKYPNELQKIIGNTYPSCINWFSARGQRKQMILRDEIFFNAIKEYIDYNRENKLKFNMYVQVQEDSSISELPQEAYSNGFLFMTFDFGSEETWVADQIILEDNLFKCILVYPGVDGFEEYPIEFPVTNIIGVSRNNYSPETRTVTFNVTKYDSDFLVKVQNSKSKLKLVNSWEN